MALFDIDEDLIVWRLLPVRLRMPIMYAWLKVLITPVKWLNVQFSANRDANLYALAHDGQVCYLEAVLNDTFDPVSRGIFIDDPVWIDPIYEPLAIELTPPYEGLASEGAPLYEPLASEVGASAAGATFIVNVPVAVPFDTNRMKALINSYKLPTKAYSIVTF